MAWNLGAISHGFFLFDYMDHLEEMNGLKFSMLICKIKSSCILIEASTGLLDKNLFF